MDSFQEGRWISFHSVTMLKRSRLCVMLLATGTCTGISLGIRHYVTSPTLAAPVPTKGDVVLVTGASGFLGQHVVKLLHQRATQVKEIRVLDTRPFKKTLDYDISKPVKVYKGDVTNIDDIRKALKGVDIVIHTAAIVDVTSRPDVKKMELVNVEGTRNIIHACHEENISTLVYTSTCDIIVGHDDVIEADENTPIPQRLLFPGYSSSKSQAENMVHKAHSSAPGTLKTISLRTGGLYGEGDTLYITGALRGAKRNKGIFYPVTNTSQALIQNTYVGNFAWAHLLAAERLNGDVTIGGQPYIITDDTPVKDITTILAPFVLGRGFKVSDKKIPFSPLYAAIWMLDVIGKIIAPVYDVNLPTTPASLTYLSHSHTYRRDRAVERLGYQPLYSYKEALAMSLRYYQKCSLGDM